MHCATVEHLKKTCRKAHLQRLQTWAKAEPAQLQTASQHLCNHLYNYIQLRYRPALPVSTPPRETHGFTSHANVRPSQPLPLFIFAYLPLYYEVDLVPLMRRLWPTAREQRIHLFTPVVLPLSRGSSSADTKPMSDMSSAKTTKTTATNTDVLRSAMIFVEVMDEDDLESTFATQGCFQIREFPGSLLGLWLEGPDVASAPNSVRCHRDDQEVIHQHPILDEIDRSLLHKDGRVRHMVLCDSYACLFPVAHATGYRPAGLVEYANEDTVLNRCPGLSSLSPSDTAGAQNESNSSSNEAEGPLHLEDVAMLVLTPGVLFDVQTGRRLGKGGGYYDRFLAYHARHHFCVNQVGTAVHPIASSSRSTAVNITEVKCTTDEASVRDVNCDNTVWEVVGIAFDSQAMHSDPSAVQQGAQLPNEIPVDVHDEVVHAVVSPTGGVEAVTEKKWRPAQKLYEAHGNGWSLNAAV